MLPAPQLETERSYLMGVAYRLLGSASDAEDVVQEALLRAPAESEVRSLRAYLTTVVTRLCLDELRSARRKRETYTGPWLPEPVLTDGLDAPFDQTVEHKENVSLAFLVVLESLTPLERAVFVLRDVFDVEFAEIAEALQRSEAACRKLLSRARQHIEERKPAAPARASQQLEVTSAFFRAVATGDLNEVIKLLADDALATTDHGGKASAAQKPVSGKERVARLLVGLMTKAQRFGDAYQSRPAYLNGAPAIIVTRADGYIETALVLRIETSADGKPQVTTVSAVRNPDKLRALARGERLTVSA